MKLLIVDDSSSQRMLLTSLLKVAGYTDLVTAESALAAFEHLGIEAHSQSLSATNIDLIMMDIDMAEMNGIEACQHIKEVESLKDIPIIMVTGRTYAEDLEAAFAAGAIDYITKPPNKVELLARVRSVLKLKSEMDQRKARERELVETNLRLEQAMQALNEQHLLLQQEQEKSERLLLNILPQPIAERLKREQVLIADSFTEVTVLFADIVEFTRLSSDSAPEDVVRWLNRVFSFFDQLAEKHGLEKIKTIGDAYMVVGGLPLHRPDHAKAVAEMALDIQNEWSTITDGSLKVRIGIHTGPVVAGVIGTRKFSYDLWGDTVNTASRMESHGVAGQIQVSQATYEWLQDDYLFEKRGMIQIKGKGELMTYFLAGRKK